MHHHRLPLAVALIFTAHVAHAQRIPATVAEAEAEGALVPRDSAPAVLPAAYHTQSSNGSAERRCVQPVADTKWPPSLRSGEIIVRGYTDLQAARNGNKILWLPLHDPGNQPLTLTIRGVRLDHPSDTIRQTVGPERVARQVRHRDSFGFPSLVRFPEAGQWLVVANVAHDWGCFVLTVAGPAH